MLAKLLVLVLLAAAIIYLLRARRQLAILAEQIRGLRDHALHQLTYTRTEGELDELAAMTRDAEAAGFTVLGDYIEESPVRSTVMAMRWFVDRAGTTFGWMAPFDTAGERVIVIVLMSHELDSQTITARAPAASTLQRPPFIKAQYVPLTATVADTVKAHRKLADLDDDRRGFVPVRTFEQLRHELERMRGKAIAWREHQPSGELLDADLRSLLGAQYERLGRAMRRRLG